MMGILSVALCGAGLVGGDGAPASTVGGADAPGVHAGLAAGRGARGFRLWVEGGRPHGAARVLVEDDGGARAAGVLALGADGAGSLTVRDWGSTRGARVLLVVQTGTGTAVAGPLGVPSFPPAVDRPHQRGDVVINEFMKDPSFVSDSNGEWIELHNTTNRPVNVEGWTISDGGSNFHMLFNGTQGLWIAPGGYFVLGNEEDVAQNGGVPVDYRYSSFTLSNGADEITLVARSGELVDTVAYDDGVFWPDTGGRSISLDPTKTGAGHNDLGTSWCHASSAISATNTDLGTPGAVNDPCP